jgi:hypothetical protein
MPTSIIAMSLLAGLPFDAAQGILSLPKDEGLRYGSLAAKKKADAVFNRSAA